MNKSRLTTLVSIFVLLVATFSNVQSAASKAEQQPGKPKHAADIILLEVKEGTSLQEDVNGKSNHKFQTNSPELDAALASLGVHGLKPLFSPGQAKKAEADSGNTVSLSRIYRLKLKPNTDVDAAVATLSAVPDVFYAEPDYIAESSSVNPAPTYNNQQITIDDPLYGAQWGMAKINIAGAWSSTYGAPTTTIAIIDSGIDTTHVDLASNLWVNPGEIAGNGIDDDSNGVIDDVNGWNFISANNDVSDDEGHGTLVAGVAAAVGGNAQGIVGVCPQCTLMTVKVMNNAGIANYSDIAAGILYAAQKGADVINLSLGGTANSNILQNGIISINRG